MQPLSPLLLRRGGDFFLYLSVKQIMTGKGFIFRVLIMGLMGGLLGGPVQATPPSRDFQKADFSKISIQTDARKREVVGIAVSFDLQFLYSAAELNRADPGSGPFDYALFCELLNPNGVPITASQDAASWRDPYGHVHANQTIRLRQERSLYQKRQFFLPYHVPNLPKGGHNVRIRIALMDAKTKKILADYQSSILPIQKPPVKLFRMKMKEVEVAELDRNKENWDYFFLTESEGLPDLKWEIQRANDPVFSSRRRKNVTRFEGNFRDNSGIFTLSKGDPIELVIIDNDMTSASDTIGRMTLNLWKEGFEFGMKEFKDFGQVKLVRFRMEEYTPPEVTISQLKLEEAARFGGVTGAKISFNYQYRKNPDPILEDEQEFGFEFFQIVDSMKKERFYPDRVIIVKGEGKLVRPGFIEFGEKDQGYLEFFIPHFYLIRDNRDKGLDFGAHGVTEMEELTFPNRLKTLKFTAPVPFLSDIRTFDETVERTNLGGSNGLLFKCRYQVPKLYYTESIRKARFLLRPSFRVGDTEIDNKVVELIAPKEFELKNGEIGIPKSERNGNLTFFIPFSRLPGAGTQSCAVRIDGWMETEEAAFLLGRERLVQEVIFPIPLEITLYVSQAKAKKLFWIGEAPQLRWKVYLGKYLQTRSSIASGAKKAFWDQQEQVTFWGPSSDEVTIELVHSGTGEADRVLGTWAGPLENLLERKGRTYKVKPFGLKKMFIEIAPFE